VVFALLRVVVRIITNGIGSPLEVRGLHIGIAITEAVINP
jgi:hypothetical protein